MASYYCHKCAKPTVLQREVLLPTCGRCGSEFVEEVESARVRGAPATQPNPPNSLDRIPYMTTPIYPNQQFPSPPPYQPSNFVFHPMNSPQQISALNNPGNHSVNYPPTYGAPPFSNYPPQNLGTPPGPSYPTQLPPSYMPKNPHVEQLSFHPGTRTHPASSPIHPYSPQFTGSSYPQLSPTIIPNESAISSGHQPPASSHAGTPGQPIYQQPPQLSKPFSQQPRAVVPIIEPQYQIPRITPSIYPLIPPVRGTDGDDLYADDTLPDTSKIDFLKTRFKCDREDPFTSSVYESIKSSTFNHKPRQALETPAPQPLQQKEAHLPQQPPQKEPPPVNQAAIISPEPQPQPQPQSQSQPQPQSQPTDLVTDLFAGFAGVIREGFDRLDEFSYQIMPASSVRRFRGGAPPAAQKEREKLQTIKIDGEEMVNQKDCPICCCDWELGESAKLMPCGHCFHDECLTPWLEQRNSCPICRYELSTEDRRYERYREHRDQK